MILSQTEKNLLLPKGNKITITAIINPITNQKTFLVIGQDDNDQSALITENITIDGIKLSHF